jgi:acetyl esterase/lipase
MNVVTIPDVVYGRKFGMALTLDIVKPQKPSGVGVLALSSGGWQSWPEMGKPQTDEFLKRGQTVFIVMHGARPKFGIPEIVQDIRRAVRFVRAHAAAHAVDPRRLGLFGISSGGHISLLTAAQGAAGDPGARDPVDRESDRPGAVACFYPPTDFMNFGETGKVWIPYRPPGETADDATLAKACSPVTHFTAAMPPTLIIHGDADKLIPVQQGRVAAARLRELGVEHRLEVRPGKEHGWPDISAEYALCADWFATHLNR